ncbi:hypothetical protein Tco_1363728, partial [Tanacetum coccineum]
IGIRALSYRELGCIRLNYAYFEIYLYPYFILSCLSDMSNSDELRHSDNTTPISPKHPDTLPHVYTRRQSTPSLLIVPSALLFYPTIRHTARISVIPAIEPNLAERARIAAINLDDYQHVPVTPPPSPSSPLSMAAYQRMIAETDPTQREGALTAIPPYGTENGRRSVPTAATSQGETALTICTTRLRGQLRSILKNMDSYSAACLEELADLMTLWNVEPRVEVNQWETPSMDELITHFLQMCEDAEDRARDARDAEDRARDAQEKAQEKRLEAFEDVVQQIRRSNY